MFRSRIVRKSLILGLALSLVAAACSSNTDPEDDGSTTTTNVSEEGVGETEAEADSSTTTTLSEEAVAQMCRTLNLLSFAGVTAGPASVSLTRTDLAELSPFEMARYSDLLISAPREACQEHIPFADEIAYWLGF